MTKRDEQGANVDPFQNDADFLEAFRAGDEAALSAVYRAYERPLKNFVLRGFAFKSDGRQLYFGGLQHRRGELFQHMFDIGVAQQRQRPGRGGHPEAENEDRCKKSYKLH